MLERRAYSRLRAFIPCRVTTDEETHGGRLLEVSLGGAAVSSRYVPSKGESIQIVVEIGDPRKTVSLPGTVVRVTRYVSDYMGESCRFGVRFNGVTPESMMLIREVMSRKD